MVLVSPLLYGHRLAVWLSNESRSSSLRPVVAVTVGQMKSIREFEEFDLTIPGEWTLGSRVVYGCELVPTSTRVREVF